MGVGKRDDLESMPLGFLVLFVRSLQSWNYVEKQDLGVDKIGGATVLRGGDKMHNYRLDCWGKKERPRL